MKREHFQIISRFSPVFLLSLFLLLAPLPLIIIDGSPLDEDVGTRMVSPEASFELQCGGTRSESNLSIFRGNNQRTGSFPYDTTDNPGLVKWVFQPNNAWVWSSPVLDENGIIYYGSGDTNLYAVYPNGTEKWHFSTGAGIQGSAAIGSDGTIYFGSDDRYFYALFPDGTLKWKLLTGEVRGTPAITEDGTILVGGDGYLWAIHPNGTESWKTITGSYISSVAIGPDGTIYESSYLDYLYALYPNGTIKWRFQTGDFVSVTPAVDNEGNIYIGSWDGYFYSIFPNGTLNWKYYMPGTVNNNFYSSPSVDVFGNIYVTSPMGGLYKFYNNGTLQWEKSPGRMYTGITIDENGILFAYYTNGYIYCLYGNYTFKWAILIGDQGRADPTIGSDGTVYTVSSAGLKAIGTREPLSPILTMNDSGNRFIHLNWTHPMEWNAPPLDNIKVYRKSYGNDYELIATLDGDALEYNDTDVVNGLNYSYQLSAVSIYGESERSNSVWSTPYGIPDPPLNVEIEVGDGYAYLTWEPPTDFGGSDLFGYDLYKGDSPENLELYTGLGDLFLSYNFTDLTNGNEYYFGLKVLTIFHTSVMSEVVSGTPKTVPGPPVNIKRYVGHSFIEIMWDSPYFNGGTPLTGYELYRNGELFSELDPGVTQFNDTDLEFGKEYVYHLIAINSVGLSPPSANVSATIKDTPTPPLNLIGVPGDSHVQLTWSQPLDLRGSPFQGYMVYRKTLDNEFELIKSIVGDYPKYNDTGLENGITYLYQVTARNTIGESDPTPYILVIPLGFPSEPLGCQVIKDNASMILNWTEPEKDRGSPITAYRIYRSNGTEWTLLGEVTTLTFEDTVLSYGYTYSYRIVAVNVLGEGPPSDDIEIGYYQPPSAPVNVMVFLADNGVSISWDIPISEGDKPIVLYRINRQIEGSSDIFRIASTTLTIYLDPNITSNKTYHYFIFAVSDAGVSNSSEKVTIEVGDLSKIDEGKPINEGEDRFPWAVLIVSIMIVLTLIGALIGFLIRKDNGSKEPMDEGGSTGEIRNVVIEGDESGFPDDEVERAPPL